MRPTSLLRFAFALALGLGVYAPHAYAQDQKPGTTPSERYTLPLGYDRASGIEPTGAPAQARVLPSPQGVARGADLYEGFNDITALPAAGWALQNNSAPIGTSSWFQGNPAVFPAHVGDPAAYIGANFNNTAGTGTISNWLMTPEMALSNGTELRFWARAADAGWADRLQVRMSTAGSSTDVGTGATDVGDFTELLLDINPTYQAGVFIDEWVEYTVTVSGLAGPASGRFAFRYFVENGGPDGANSDFIGIDEVSIILGDDPPPVGGILLEEDFEAGLPSDWAIFANEFGVAATQWAAFDHSALGNIARSNFSSDVTDDSEDYLATPLIELGQNSSVSFDAAQSFTADWGSTYEVLVSTTSQTDIAAYTTVAAYTEADFPLSSAGAATFVVDLSEYDGQSVYVAFMHRQNDGDVFHLDNVVVSSEEGGSGDMTIAEARAEGAGATVTVSGVVTRAQGAFTYFQDETGGLTVRQTAGDFFDDVTDGTITEGTEIRVTGTLSEFRGLLQINADDLDSYEVLSQENDVEPQVITLAELIANGEAYEAELVRVMTLETDATGTFAPATSYDVGDPTTALSDNNILRIPNAGDSNVDGLPIPEEYFTFTGVVGQFTPTTGGPPDEGYQLLAIEEGDIQEEATPDLTFSPPLSTGLVVTAESGTTTTGTITMTNNSEEPIAFEFTQYSGGGEREAPYVHPALQLGKGERDPRAGTSALRGSGGPDGFGYTWIDSNEPNGPAYNWVDISGTGTAVSLGDDASQTVPLPFAFEFYGVEQTNIRIVSNGWLGFGGTSNAFFNEPIPTAATPNNFIAPYWDDFNPSAGGTIHYQNMGDGRFIVQWTNVPHYEGGSGVGSYTFQAILYQSGAIKYQYESFDFAGHEGSGTIGIENATGTDGLQVVFNAPYAQEGLAILIQAAPPFVTDVEPASGVIAPGESVDVEVSFDATGLNGGTYEGTLTIETDEPASYDYPVTLVVTGEGDLVISPDPVAFGEVIVGASATQEVTISNEGTDNATISAVTAEDDAFSTDFDGPVTLAPGESTTVTVTFAPTEEGDVTATLSVISDKPGSPETATLTGTGLRAPEASVDPTSLIVEVQEGQTATTQFTLSNDAEAGAADLVFDISVVAERLANYRIVEPTMTRGGASAAKGSGEALVSRANGSTSPQAYVEYTGTPRTISREGGVVVTHSLSSVVEELAGVACGGAGGTAENSFWRVFDLSQFDLAGGLDVTSVDIGVETVDGAPVGSMVRLYTLNGPFTTANLTLVGEASYTLQPGTALTTVNVPVTGSFEADDVMVVEWAVDDARPTVSFVYPGANNDGQTGPTYLSSATCGVNQPTSNDAIGFPDFHWVLLVNGESGPSLVSISPESGSIAPGESEDIVVSVDATEVPAGTYEFQVLVATNDPANPVLTVDLTVEVAEIIANEGDALPVSFALGQNYPNPFAARTAIEYALPTSTPVRIAVYDAVGRLVATLVDAERPAGYHSVEWNANGAAAGVYFYRIEAGPFRSTQRMVLVR